MRALKTSTPSQGSCCKLSGPIVEASSQLLANDSFPSESKKAIVEKFVTDVSSVFDYIYSRAFTRTPRLYTFTGNYLSAVYNGNFVFPFANAPHSFFFGFVFFSGSSSYILARVRISARMI